MRKPATSETLSTAVLMPSITPEVVAVQTDSLSHDEGNVVARFNLKHRVWMRTHHTGPKPAAKIVKQAMIDAGYDIAGFRLV